MGQGIGQSLYYMVLFAGLAVAGICFVGGFRKSLAMPIVHSVLNALGLYAVGLPIGLASLCAVAGLVMLFIHHYKGAKKSHLYIGAGLLMVGWTYLLIAFVYLLGSRVPGIFYAGMVGPLVAAIGLMLAAALSSPGSLVPRTIPVATQSHGQPVRAQSNPATRPDLICPHCAIPNDSDAVFCEGCGKKLISQGV